MGNSVPCGQPSPTLQGYTAFLRAECFPSANLPDGSPSIVMSLQIAVDIVNPVVECASPTLYTLAVYNLATDRLINYGQDVEGQKFFANLRTKFKIDEPAVGIVSASSNESTSTTLLNPEQLKHLTLADLQTLKTPYGRRYMGIAQGYGQETWGLS